jgi:negative regulator of sigma E activity
MTEPTDFEKRTREALDESAGRLDGRTRSRLTQARHAALAQLEHPQRHWWRSFVPAGAAAAVAVLAVVIWSGSPEQPMASPGDDMELLADADAPDFVNDGEDLEFYEWAAGEVET